jgi:type II secretory pathway component GspD/PulD (secretin)/tetratricopeptide (TPR) repeat protein
MALWAEIAVQAQNAPVVKSPAQVAEEEAVRRQEAVKQINTYLDRADKARATGDWTEAARLYSDAYKTLSQVGQTGATEEYRRIAAGITEVSVYEAEQALRQGDYNLAVEKLDYALRVDPTSLKAQRAREAAVEKRALMKNRVTSKEVREHGEDVLVEAAELNQMVHDAKMLYEMGSYQKAQEILQAVLKVDPDHRAAQNYQKLLEEKYASNIMRQRSLVADSSIVDVARAWVLTTNAQNLPIPNVMANTNLVHTGMGRQRILNKLDRITVAELRFPGISLGAVAQELQELSIKNDPDGAGVNFLISNGIDQKRAGLDSLYTDYTDIDPMTGMPRIGTGMMLGSMGGGGMGGGGMGGMGGGGMSANQFMRMVQDAQNIGEKYNVYLEPGLRNVRLMDILDAVVKCCDRPLKYSVEDYAVIFSARELANDQFFQRTFRVDPNTFWQGLVSVSSEEVGVEGSGGTSSRSSGSTTGGYVARVYTAGNSSGGGGGGGSQDSGGLPYVTMELDSGMVQERVRLFFQSVTGVQFTSGSYSTQGIGMMMMAGGGLQSLSGMLGGQGGMGGGQQMMQQDQQMGTARPGHTLVFNDRRGLLWVRSTTEVLDVIEQVIQTLNAPPPQLSIEVKFVEVEQNDSKALGFDWYLGNFTFGSGKVGATGGTAPVYQGNPTESNPLGSFPSYSDASAQTMGNITSGLAENNSGIPTLATITGILTDPQFRLVIRAMESRTGVEVMSAPRLVTLSGRQAQIQSTTLRNIATDAEVSASEVSSTSGTSVSGGTSATVQAMGMVQPESAAVATGPTLDVIPYVSADGYSIQMTLIPSVVQFLGYGNPDVPAAAEFEASLQAQAGNLSSPVPLPRFLVRQVTTSVIVWDGQTVMLGGLISEDVSRTREKVPVLGDLPLVGRLFRSESNSSGKKNLIIFVSPQIIDPAGNPVHDLTDIENLPYNPNSVPIQADRDIRVAPGTLQASTAAY